MSIIRLELPDKESPVTGKSVSFIAPCDCTQAEYIQINAVNYSVVDAIGRVVTGKTGVWAKDSLVTVILNCEDKKAYIQNCAIPEHDHQDATQQVHGYLSIDDKKKLDGIEPGANKITVESTYSKDSNNPASNKSIHEALTNAYLNLTATDMRVKGIILTEEVDYGTTLPAPGTPGRLFLLKSS